MKGLSTTACLPWNHQLVSFCGSSQLLDYYGLPPLLSMGLYFSVQMTIDSMLLMRLLVKGSGRFF